MIRTPVAVFVVGLGVFGTMGSEFTDVSGHQAQATVPSAVHDVRHPERDRVSALMQGAVAVSSGMSVNSVTTFTRTGSIFTAF